jgi:hypothetical protein
MEKLLARLERRLGRYAIHNLIGVIVGGMAIVWVLSLLKPEFQDRLTLDMAAVRHGQVWRLITFLFIPPPSSPMWVLINLYFTWWIGNSLEQRWGPFKFNAYYLLGALGCVVAAAIVGPATNFWLDISLFLAFATVFPDVSILLFFVIPIRVKWLGVIAAAFMGYAAFMDGWGARASIAASLVNYFLFFGEHWYGVITQRGTLARQKARLESMRPAVASRGAAPSDDGRPVFGERVCAMCGAREADGTDIRVCSCEKCGGPRTLCLDHARNH